MLLPCFESYSMLRRLVAIFFNALESAFTSSSVSSVARPNDFRAFLFVE